jgi:hypothetical protein
MTLRWLTIPMTYLVLAGTPLVAHALKSGTDATMVAASRPALPPVRPGAALYDADTDGARSTTSQTWLAALADSAARAVSFSPAEAASARPSRVFETLAGLDGVSRPLPDNTQLGALR